MRQVEVVSREDYLSFIEKQPWGNFMQYPSWAEVKTEWKNDLLGWFDDEGHMVGCALVLYRKLPGLNKYLAYIPRGPVIDWNTKQLQEWFEPFFEYLRRKNVFSVKMEPPVVRAKWKTPTIRSYLKEVRAHGLKGKTLRDLGPDEVDGHAEYIQQELERIGWKLKESEGGFSAIQPQFVFRLPLKGRSLEDVFAGFHTNWRRNVRKAEKQGVKVTVGGEEELPEFYELLKVTAQRDNFVVRNYSYFETMYRSLKREDPNRIQLYLARYDGKLLASTIAIHANGHTWYLYGASGNEMREKMPNHAIQWRMIQDAHEMGAHTYDFRGISHTLDESNPLYGLLRFKLGFGGEACQLIGEWDYPLQPLLQWAFDMYMKKR
ncbi:lipid II:glycine glycyltransferase (peptidoglycan interpeptide bridge formation enzyme) [Melghirimyces profundicolus]|uniref:Lipid II:glycine glycyltransferase n=1 Tax=Melghirimyces profundicolus TaxID=1242148 RepID=A0A2T6BTJ4_9BACL|nr:peptidoglycan bridge formation glycyltransferase FemA/FemB family protein [Melghirimyces profundicolus]PTX59356.1 lipid II:glycine glycyltransferase (peptidoglycan interpeptide bridge formation enzyme) [Melghirimyces profundicolus]